jgi:hypothetical protein
MSRISAASILIALSLASACDDKKPDIVSPSSVALVDFVNATPVSVIPYVGATAAAPVALTFQQATTGCTVVQPSSQTLTFKNTSTPPADVAASPSTALSAGVRYTTILATNGTASSVMSLPETFANVAAGSYGLRIVNATGTAADFYVTAPAAAVSGTPTAALAALSATGGATGANGYITTVDANTRVRMFTTGTQTGALSTFDIANTPATQGVTVVFAKNAIGALAPFIVMQCF